MKNIDIRNRKASFDYVFIDDYVAGIQLVGTEVKSIRDGKVSLVDSFCFFKDDELFVKGMNITEWKTSFNHDPLRDRKLLLNRVELNKLRKSLDKGMTIVIKRLFSNEKNLIKAEIALAKGKKNYDKRESLKEKDIERQMKQYD